MPSPALLHVPSIDIAPFFSGSATDKRRVADAVAAACRDIGFLVISGHGIPVEFLDQAFQRTFAFYDLPVAEKNRWHPTGSAQQRGYHGVETRNLASTIGDVAPPDLRESVFLGPVEDHRAHFAHLADAATAYAPNLIPDTPAGTRAGFIALYRAFETLGADIMAIFAVALALPEDHFAAYIDRHFSILGAHHYPALRAAPRGRQLRAGAHTDFGALTILAMTEGRGGLEVRMQDGAWAAVLPKKGDLVVNLGDMMQRWTNDVWVSTLHRVAAPAVGDAQSRRLSFGYFLHPNFDADIRCIESCLGPGETPRHPPISAGEHIRRKIEATHKAG
jgi:isopenicillin N synthase-like dioxygenase